jgi:hypothetical protein
LPIIGCVGHHGPKDTLHILAKAFQNTMRRR